MHKVIQPLFLAACLLLVPALTIAASHPAIIPQPRQATWGEGTLVLRSNVSVSAEAASLRPAADYLATMLRRATGYKVPVRAKGGTIQLAIGKGEKAEGYRLAVTAKGVRIEAPSYHGVINGIATLRQLLGKEVEAAATVAGHTWAVPHVEIQDAPRYDWRGMMLDCSRHFFSKQEVMRLLDVLALYKIDRFHWHLTDDQGWRIEIKRYPLLTERGAWRTYNHQDSVCMRRAAEEDQPNMRIPADKVRRNAQGQDEYGGYYTQDDIREVVAYAAVRGIEVIPEIDMPGHSLQAVNNYAGLSCFPQTGWGRLFTTPMCPGKDTMLEFCKNVWTEVFDLFPSRYVHIGGDEVDMSHWKRCADCQKRMRENGLKNEHQLQSWFNHQMEAFFNAHGKDMIGWDEIVEGGLSATTTVMWWRTWTPASPKLTTAHGNGLICTPTSPFYVSQPEDARSLEAILEYDPTAGLTADESVHALGIQGNLWAESVPSIERVWHMAFPRMLAIAELGWSAAREKDYAEFTRRLTAHFPRLQAMGVGYRISDVTGFHAVNVFTDRKQVALTCADHTATIRYTTDGSVPQATSPQYTAPIMVEHDTDFAFRAFGPDGSKGDIARTAYRREDYAPDTTVAGKEAGLSAVWHDYAGEECAEIETAAVLGTFATDGVVIPAEAKDNIGLIFSGYIEVPADGIYTFALLSDDGSQLEIDGRMVVDNGGPHSPVERVGQHAMRQGLHTLRARYFDHNGGQLRLLVTDDAGQPVTVRYWH